MGSEKNQQGKDQSNFKLESDRRFNRLVQIMLEKARKKVKRQQIRHLEIVGRAFAEDPKIKILSIIREPDGAGGADLKEYFSRGAEKSRIILLLNGIVMPQDISIASPFLEKWGMIGLRLAHRTHGRVIELLNETIREDTISGYIINTVRQIQTEIFEEKPCEVDIVFNASKEDLLCTVEMGGENTVLVVGGHGKLGSVSMTNGAVINKDIPTPKEPLMAFVQHTCAAPGKSKEEMGERWSQQTYGWKRGTDPTDFVDNPLVPRNPKKGPTISP